MYLMSEVYAATFNYWDVIVFVFIGFFMINGYRLGFIKSVFGMVSFAAAIIITYYFLPAAAKFLRVNTGIYDVIKTTVADSLGLKELALVSTKQAETRLIDSLHLPEFIKTSLLANNNDTVYEILGVNTIVDYIAGYIANICVNVIAVVLLLVISGIVLSVIVNILDLVSKLPVINTMNKFGGILFGFFQGVLCLWVIFIIITLFAFIPFFKYSYMVLMESAIAGSLYNSNLLLKIILDIFT